MKKLSALIAAVFASVSLGAFAQAPAKPAEPAKPAAAATPAAPSAKAEAPAKAEVKKAEAPEGLHRQAGQEEVHQEEVDQEARSGRRRPTPPRPTPRRPPRPSPKRRRSNPGTPAVGKAGREPCLFSFRLRPRLPQDTSP